MYCSRTAGDTRMTYSSAQNNRTIDLAIYQNMFFLHFYTVVSNSDQNVLSLSC